jgi:hypothetical protein
MIHRYGGGKQQLSVDGHIAKLDLHRLTARKDLSKLTAKGVRRINECGFPQLPASFATEFS